jgi:hypothetical protein
MMGDGEIIMNNQSLLFALRLNFEMILSMDSAMFGALVF